MLSSALLKVFGSRNERVLKKYYNELEKINSLSLKFGNMTIEELREYSLNLKSSVRESKVKLSDIKHEAFALCREMSNKVMGMRHFDVQIIGGLVLNDGRIAEMRTGEGKTLVATLAVYYNALSGDGVHVITTNDYLAERDANIMKPLYEALGLTVGANISKLSKNEKREVYNCDIVYGTNSEFGFDYLKNNLAVIEEERTQKKLNFVVIDEVDSILIDEARTPLIISGVDNNSTDMVVVFNEISKELLKGEHNEITGKSTNHFYVDEEKRAIVLNEKGYHYIEDRLLELGIIQNRASMYNNEGVRHLHLLENALRAHYLFHVDNNYIIKDGEIVIVDDFTGRLAEGRRWSDGLHQAVEAKENVKINKESKTLATITYQNFFLLYNKLSGMTGTAITEQAEFMSIYNLETIVIPTNKPIKRIDHLDVIYPTKQSKLSAIVREIKLSHAKGQPVLVGTSSIESTEEVSKLLQKAGLQHNVLNAKLHALEAEVIAQAGKISAITIATNMAGRGTDIILGGNIKPQIDNIRSNELIDEEEKRKLINEIEELWAKEHELVLNAGGLKVIGVEKNEARRIDNQLRGRSGRQGDVGESIFFLSLEDDLFRIFGGDKFQQMISRLNLADSNVLQSSFVSKLLNNAQIKLETNNFNIRKQLLEYDAILNEQRKKYYELRESVFNDKEIVAYLYEMIPDYVDSLLLDYNIFEKNDGNNKGSDYEMWNIDELVEKLKVYSINIDLIKIDGWKNDYNTTAESIKNDIIEIITKHYELKWDESNYHNKNNLEKVMLLQILDLNWQQHLTEMDRVKALIHLRAYAQKDPKQEYKKEAHLSFIELFF